MSLLKFHRCITHTGNPGSGKGDLEIKISYKWMVQKEEEKKEEKEKKSDKFWIIDLCESTQGANYQVLK